MSKIIFNIQQINQLEENPNVTSVSERSIQYSVEFKVKAVHENMEGKGPRQIFTEAGFDLKERVRLPKIGDQPPLFIKILQNRLVISQPLP